MWGESSSAEPDLPSVTQSPSPPSFDVHVLIGEKLSEKPCFSNGWFEKYLETHPEEKARVEAQLDGFVKSSDQIAESQTCLLSEGLSLWRETFLGQCLTNALDDLMLDSVIELEDIFPIVQTFDIIATKKLPTDIPPKENFKITSGEMTQYKNIDGTWVIYVRNLNVKGKKRRFNSSLIRIVAAELDTLQAALRNSTTELKEYQVIPAGCLGKLSTGFVRVGAERLHTQARLTAPQEAPSCRPQLQAWPRGARRWVFA